MHGQRANPSPAGRCARKLGQMQPKGGIAPVFGGTPSGNVHDGVVWIGLGKWAGECVGILLFYIPPAPGWHRDRGSKERGEAKSCTMGSKSLI